MLVIFSLLLCDITAIKAEYQPFYKDLTTAVKETHSRIVAEIPEKLHKYAEKNFSTFKSKQTRSLLHTLARYLVDYNEKALYEVLVRTFSGCGFDNPEENLQLW